MATAVIFPSLFLSDLMFANCPNICHSLSFDPLILAYYTTQKKIIKYAFGVSCDSFSFRRYLGKIK